MSTFTRKKCMCNDQIRCQIQLEDQTEVLYNY